MKPDHYLIVANWKMQLSFNEALMYAQNNREHFINLGKKSGIKIVLCPSFTELHTIQDLFLGSQVNIGAQDCSAFKAGAHTGQVQAETLAQIGCHYCIIGHSERRQHTCETNENIAEKTLRLLEQNIKPIICIGETIKDYEQNRAISVLDAQLKPIITKVATIDSSAPIYFAYEPIWSIGTGILPSVDYLTDIFGWISEQTKIIGKKRTLGLLYGGSVSDTTVTQFKKISTITGLLVGGASLDFQKFNNIVNSI